MTLSNEKKGRNHEAKRTFFNSSMSVAAPMTLNAFPAKLKPPAPSCVNEPSKLNPCPIVCYVLVLTKEQGKGKWGLPTKKSCQGFGRLFGKGGLFGRPFFKTNPQELSTLCIYPENSGTTQRLCQSTKYCLSQILPNTLSCNFGGTSH